MKRILLEKKYITLLIRPDGKLAGIYRKNNLFAARFEKKKIQEADIFDTGKRINVAEGEGFRIGTAICYDLRFSEVFSRYRRKGCDIITVPSNFTYKTGKDHWEILLRARAIENKCYILAPNQVGIDSNRVRAYGNSMIVDPWGRILARAGDNQEEIVFADIDKKEIETTRKILP